MASEQQASIPSPQAGSTSNVSSQSSANPSEQPANATASSPQSTAKIPAPTPSPLPNRRKLPLLSERFTERFVGWIPDWLIDPFRDNQRKLMAMERRVQRRFLAEYRGQVNSLEPVLKERGLFIGRAIVDAFAGQHQTDVSYESASSSEAAKAAVFESNIRELVVTLDPIIAPVLNPFVEGLKTPINEELSNVETQVKKAIMVVAGVSLMTGFVMGRWSGSWGGGGKGGSSRRRD